MPTIKQPSHITTVTRDISNLNRSFGTRISGEIAKYYGDEGLLDDSIRIKLNGTTGQSLGALS